MMKRNRFSFRYGIWVAALLGGLPGWSSCANKRMQVNPGAYVTIDGTDDGLRNVQKEFKDAARTESGITVTLASDVAFDINSSYLNAAAKSELDKLVQTLSEFPNVKLLVEGHTDATGTVAYNNMLSEKRASSVRDYLVSKGIKKEHIAIKGHGPSKPLAPNNTPEGRLKNRRVEITLLD